MGDVINAPKPKGNDPFGITFFEPWWPSYLDPKIPPTAPTPLIPKGMENEWKPASEILKGSTPPTEARPGWFGSMSPGQRVLLVLAIAGGAFLLLKRKN